MINIFLASDNNYSPFVATTIASICSTHTSPEKIIFYIIEDKISETNKYKIKEMQKNFSFDIIFIQNDAEKFSNIFNKHGRKVNKMTFCRLLIPDIAPNINKAIYLDIDIVVLRDISTLWNEDLGNYELGAIPEYYSTKMKYKKYLKKSFCYFNAGVLLMDTAKMRKDNCVNRFMKINKKFRENLWFLDQDILNIYYHNNYKILDKKYNVVNTNVHWKNFLKIHNWNKLWHVRKSCVIRHYCCRHKPWNIRKLNIPHFGDFWRFASMTPFYEELQIKYKEKNAFRDIKNPIKRFYKKIRNLF
ncbi:MAG: glycosyltransferase family 8 protein [Rickettsiales bacterium]|jgi:lipopolysaccharide biosynthesis glycosyltransferase|nr:glycosyltransferase family 8 protein [Rickettsiales bacterium]